MLCSRKAFPFLPSFSLVAGCLSLGFLVFIFGALHL